MKSALVAASIVTVILASVVGCGKGKSGPTGTINGKLTLEGASPGAGTQIQFMSETGSTSAIVAADGSFTIMGAPVGTYQVMVTPGAGSASTGAMNPEDAMKMVASEGAEGKGANPDAFQAAASIPAKYTEFATNDEKLVVKEGANEYALDMKKE